MDKDSWDEDQTEADSALPLPHESILQIKVSMGLNRFAGTHRSQRIQPELQAKQYFLISSGKQLNTIALQVIADFA